MSSKFRGKNSWKLEKIPAVSKTQRGITSPAPSAHPSSKHTSQINACFLRTWSAHFVGFFQYICETRTSSHRSFPGGSVSHAQVQLIICQSQQETPFFSAFVELNNKIEHVLQRGRLGSSLQASVPRYWIRRLPPPPYLFSAWLFAFTIKRHLHYLLEKQQKKWESKPVWPLGGGRHGRRASESTED